jgi:hypothetical protein
MILAIQESGVIGMAGMSQHGFKKARSTFTLSIEL